MDETPFSWERLVWVALGALGTTIVSVVVALTRLRREGRKDFADALAARLDKVEANHDQCVKDHAAAQAEVKSLTERLARLEQSR